MENSDSFLGKYSDLTLEIRKFKQFLIEEKVNMNIRVSPIWRDLFGKTISIDEGVISIAIEDEVIEGVDGLSLCLQCLLLDKIKKDLNEQRKE